MGRKKQLTLLLWNKKTDDIIFKRKMYVYMYNKNGHCI